MPHLAEKFQPAQHQIPIRILLRDRLGRSESHTVYARYGENLLDVLSRNFEITLKSGELGTWVTSIRGKGIQISEDACGGLQGYINGTLPYTIVNSSPFFLGFTNIAVTSEFELRMQYDPYLEDIKPPLSFMLITKLSALFDGIGRKNGEQALLECASCSAPLNESLRKSIGIVVGSHEIKHYTVGNAEEKNAVNTAIASICCGSLPLPQHMQEFGDAPGITVPAPNAYRLWESIAMHKLGAEENCCSHTREPMAPSIHITEPVTQRGPLTGCKCINYIKAAAVPKNARPSINAVGSPSHNHTSIKEPANASVPFLQLHGTAPNAILACIKGPMRVAHSSTQGPKRRERKKPVTKTIGIAENAVVLRGSGATHQPNANKLGDNATRKPKPKPNSRKGNAKAKACNPPMVSNDATRKLKPKPNSREGNAKAKACNLLMFSNSKKCIEKEIRGRAKMMGLPPKLMVPQNGSARPKSSRSIARIMFLMDLRRNVRLNAGAKRLLACIKKVLARQIIRGL